MNDNVALFIVANPNQNRFSKHNKNYFFRKQNSDQNQIMTLCDSYPQILGKNNTAK